MIAFPGTSEGGLPGLVSEATNSSGTRSLPAAADGVAEVLAHLAQRAATDRQHGGHIQRAGPHQPHVGGHDRSPTPTPTPTLALAPMAMPRSARAKAALRQPHRHRPQDPQLHPRARSGYEVTLAPAA
jgi:hypothetical protein